MELKRESPFAYKTPASIFFSVVIPTYNRAHLVGKTIDSVLAQKYDRFEVIVVDDGSTDNTEQVLSKYTADPKFSYYKKENAERGAARNYGFNKAKGSYVFFIDSDDLMREDHLAVMNRSIKDLDPQPDFLAPGFVIINPDGSFNYPGHSLKKGWYDKKVVLRGNPFACLIAVKKNNPSLIPYTEDRELAIMEDWIFLLENLKENKLYILDEQTIRMVEHDARSMADNLKVIDKRKKATEYILNKVSLSKAEQKEVKAGTNYFCAVHYSIEGQKGKAFSYLVKSFFRIPFKKSLSLIVKLVVGKKIFKWLKSVIRTFL